MCQGSNPLMLEDFQERLIELVQPAQAVAAVAAFNYSMAYAQVGCAERKVGCILVASTLRWLQ
jgi:hypothetical protein